MLVTAQLRPPGKIVEVSDARRVGDLLARLEVKPSTVLVIRDGDKVEVRFAISGGALP